MRWMDGVDRGKREKEDGRTRPITTSLSAASITSLVTLVAERTTRPWYWGMMEMSSSFGRPTL